MFQTKPVHSVLGQSCVAVEVTQESRNTELQPVNRPDKVARLAVYPTVAAEQGLTKDIC